MDIEPVEEEKVSLLKKLRKSVLPKKATDNPIVKVGKDAGFIVFVVLIICVSFGIILGISLAL